MKIYVINGPNLNMLGIREPGHYGTMSFPQLLVNIKSHCNKYGIDVEFYQSNHEGDLVDYIQKAYFEGIDGIVINPGAYTHTSIAILDAVKSTMIPTIEVHISKLDEREDFRQISYIRLACIDSVIGLGTDGYNIAIDKLYAYLKGE